MAIQLITHGHAFPAPSHQALGQDVGHPHMAGFGRLFLCQEAGQLMQSKVGWGEIWTVRDFILK